MKASVYKKYGPVDQLRVEEISDPKPGEGRVLVEVHHSSVNPVDWKVMEGAMRLLHKGKFPRITGSDWAGVVLESDVPDYKPGAEVWGMTSTLRGGAHAGKLLANPSEMSLMPKNLSLQEAGAMPLAALTALRALQDLGAIQENQKVLVNGASGGVGHFAVQLANAFGTEVTGICSGKNVDFVRELGAKEVLDYEKDALDDLGRFDLIVDCVPNLPIFKLRKLLVPRGKYISTLPRFWTLLHRGLTWWLPVRRGRFVIVRNRHENLKTLKFLCEKGLVKPHLEKTFPLDEIADAFRHNQKGHTIGKLGIKMPVANS